MLLTFVVKAALHERDLLLAAKFGMQSAAQLLHQTWISSDFTWYCGLEYVSGFTVMTCVKKFIGLAQTWTLCTQACVQHIGLNRRKVRF